MLHSSWLTLRRWGGGIYRQLLQITNWPIKAIIPGGDHTTYLGINRSPDGLISEIWLTKWTDSIKSWTQLMDWYQQESKWTDIIWIWTHQVDCFQQELDSADRLISSDAELTRWTAIIRSWTPQMDWNHQKLDSPDGLISSKVGLTRRTQIISR